MESSVKEWKLSDVFEALGKNDAYQLTQILNEIEPSKLNELIVPKPQDFGKKGSNPKASPSIQDTGMTALHLLCISPSESPARLVMLKALLERGADPNAKCLDSKQTPLFFAVMSESLILLRELVEKGGDVRYADNNGNTLLHCAAQIGKMDIFKYLLDDCKLELNRKNEMGWLPYHISLRYNKRDIVEYILENGQDVNADLVSSKEPNQKNQFPVFILAKFGHFALCKWLVEKKGLDACPNGIDLQPSRVAATNEFQKLSQFLMKYKKSEPETSEKQRVNEKMEDEEIAKGERCANCRKKEEKKDDLKNCGRCQKLAYCTRECQVAHWKVHKLACQAPQ